MEKDKKSRSKTYPTRTKRKLTKKNEKKNKIICNKVAKYTMEIFMMYLLTMNKYKH